MKKLKVIMAVLLAVILAVTAALPVAAANYMEIYLYAGQTTYAGYVAVNNDGTNLNATFYPAPGYQFIQTHIAVADSAADLPQNKAGNPQVGKFISDPGNSYSILFADTNGDGKIFIAVHAVVTTDGGCTTETAWGTNTCQGTGFGFAGGSWATYVSYSIILPS